MSCGRSRPVPVCFCGQTSTRRASADGAPSASPNGSGSPGMICGACSRRLSASGVRGESCPWSCFLIGALCWSDARPASCACCRRSICKTIINHIQTHIQQLLRTFVMRSGKTCCDVFRKAGKISQMSVVCQIHLVYHL